MIGQVIGGPKTPFVCAADPPEGMPVATAAPSVTANVPTDFAAVFGRTPVPRPKSAGARRSFSLMITGPLASPSSAVVAVAACARTSDAAISAITDKEIPHRNLFMVPLQTYTRKICQI